MEYRMRFLQKAAIILFAFALSCQVVIAGAQIAYHVTVNTSAVNSLSGFLDLQFNPGGADTLPATLVISNFATDGTLNNTISTTGSVSGALPGPPNLTFINSAVPPFNDYFGGDVFGNTISFDATFSGAAFSPSTPFPSAGSTFAFSLYAADGITPLLTTDPSGAALFIDVLVDGSTSTQNFPSDMNGGAPIATAALIVPNAVPEPGAVPLVFGLVLAGVCFTHRKNR